MNISRMRKGCVSHDTCNAALSHGNKLGDAILSKAKSEGISEEELIIHQGNCFHHLRNVWSEAIENFLATRLEDHMRDDLKMIPPHIRVSCKLENFSGNVTRLTTSPPTTPKAKVTNSINGN